jgi:hypothetical protein
LAKTLCDICCLTLYFGDCVTIYRSLPDTVGTDSNVSGASTKATTRYMSSADSRSLVSGGDGSFTGTESFAGTEGEDAAPGPGHLLRRTPWMAPVQGERGEKVPEGYDSDDDD